MTTNPPDPSVEESLAETWALIDRECHASCTAGDPVDTHLHIVRVYSSGLPSSHCIIRVDGFIWPFVEQFEWSLDGGDGLPTVTLLVPQTVITPGTHPNWSAEIAKQGGITISVHINGKGFGSLISADVIWKHGIKANYLRLKFEAAVEIVTSWAPQPE